MFKIFILLFITIGIGASTINIAVAANVSYAIDELKKEFKKSNPNVEVRVTLGSSGKLTAQIKNGAPYHLFMSANMKYPEALYEDAIAITEPVVYAKGSLAILSRTKQDFSKGIEAVNGEGIRKIAVANPKTAPYGKAAVDAMKNGGIYEKAVKKFIYGESVSQTVSYAITAADIGFVAKSSLYSPRMARFKEGVNWCDIDAKLYTPISQGIVILKKAKEDLDAKAFYDFILSQSAQKIFKRYGYILP